MNIAEILRRLADVVDGAESDSPQDIAQQVPHQDQSAQLHTVEPGNGENKEVINTRSMVAPLQQKLDLMKKLAGVEGTCTSCGCDPCGCKPNGEVSDQPDELDIIKQNAGIPTFTIMAADDDEPFEG
jgi:hypothetical protein